MREIKFRSWDGRELDYNFLLNSKGIVEESDWDCSGTAPVTVQPIIMQYTGLKDKNGKEIYEGDILYVAGQGNLEVKKDNGFELSFEDEDEFFEYNDIYEDIETVIGNIYETPELIK